MELYTTYSYTSLLNTICNTLAQGHEAHQEHEWAGRWTFNPWDSTCHGVAPYAYLT